MAIKYLSEPKLNSPDLVCSWPGIGSIGFMAVEEMRKHLHAEPMAEIEPEHFFEPHNVVIENGLIRELQFPQSRFYYKQFEQKDLLLFSGEEQAVGYGGAYASGERAYELAQLVLDVAEKHGCRRIYTSGACVSPTHHRLKPRVVTVVSSEEMKDEMKRLPNVVLMSEVGEGLRRGVITGLNGLLLSLAQKRGLEAICLMGEIPDWLSRAPFPYPSASKSVLQVLSKIWDFSLKPDILESKAAEVEQVIESLYEKFPPEMKEQYDLRKSLVQPGPITEREAQWMKDHLDDFLKSISEEEEGGDDDDDDEKPV